MKRCAMFRSDHWFEKKWSRSDQKWSRSLIWSKKDQITKALSLLCIEIEKWLAKSKFKRNECRAPSLRLFSDIKKSCWVWKSDFYTNITEQMLWMVFWSFYINLKIYTTEHHVKTFLHVRQIRVHHNMKIAFLHKYTIESCYPAKTQLSKIGESK